MNKKELIKLIIETPILIGNKPCGSQYCNECSKKETCKLYKAWTEYEREKTNERNMR